jgi:isoamylase
VEGSTTDPAVTAPRRRQVRNLPLTLVLSRGVPIQQAGDEFRHTQLGNNNAYCQDNQLTWLDWTPDAERRSLADVTRRLLRLRADEPVFRRGHFSQGRPLLGGDVTEFRLLRPTGRETREEDWTTPVQTLGVLLVGEEIGERERTVIGNSYLVLLNAADTRVDFELPPRLTASTSTWCSAPPAASWTTSR